MSAGQHLAADPSARVGVFVDGQNLYQGCQRTFGHALCHPHLLAEALAGPRIQHPPFVRFYTGRASPNKKGEAVKAARLDRRLRAMARMGVTPITRPLRYHWDWGHREDLPRPHRDAEPRQVTMGPWERPQEKGIDLVLALDVMELLLSGACDVAIVVSRDRDLCEIPKALHTFRKLLDPRPMRLEAAIPVEKLPSRVRVEGFHYTHHFDRKLFQLIRDDTDYTVDDKKWELPTFPRTLDERRQQLAEEAQRVAARAVTPPSQSDLTELQERFRH